MQRKYLHSTQITFIIICLLFTTTYAQWKKLNSRTTVNLTAVTVIDSSSAMVIGEKGSILKTSDSGNSWQKVYLGISNNLNAISNRYQFFSEKNSIIVAGDSILLMSSDNEKTWSIKSEPYNFTTIDQGFATPLRHAEPLQATFNMDSTIVLGTDDGRIVYSNDKGDNWKDTLLLDSKIIAINFDLYGLIPLGSGTTSRVLAASNFEYLKGDIADNEWDKYGIGIYIPWQNITSGDLAYSYKFLIGDGGEIALTPLLLRKEENESTWTNISQNLQIGLFPNKIKNLGFAIFICGKSGKILESTNDGDKWIEQITSVNTKLNDVSFLNNFSYYNPDIGYAVGDSGTILYTSNGGISGVEKNSSLLPKRFELYQNYPNPFNPETKIKYEIPKDGKVSIIIYDNLGQRVRVLVNSFQSAGEHYVQFNSNGLPSGLYLYELKFNSSSLVKKMLLLK